MGGVEVLYLRHVLAGVDSAVFQLLCHAVAVVSVLYLSPADVEADDPLFLVGVLHVDQSAAEGGGLVVSAEVVDHAALAHASLAVSDPDDMSVIGLFSQQRKEMLLPRSGLEAFLFVGACLQGGLQVADALAELDVRRGESLGNLTHGGSRLDQVPNLVQVGPVTLGNPSVAILCRSKVAGLLLTAVGDVLVSGPTRCLHVSSLEKSHGGLESCEAHGLVELAVALDVQRACCRCDFCLADSVADALGPECVPVEDDLAGNHACADVGGSIRGHEVLVYVAREAVASVYSGHGEEWLRQLGACLKSPALHGFATGFYCVC